MESDNRAKKKAYTKPEVKEFKASGENPWVLGQCSTDCVEMIFPAQCNPIDTSSE